MFSHERVIIRRGPDSGLPIIVAAGIGQRAMVAGLTAGAVKG